METGADLNKASYENMTNCVPWTNTNSQLFTHSKLSPIWGKYMSSVFNSTYDTDFLNICFLYEGIYLSI